MNCLRADLEDQLIQNFWLLIQGSGLHPPIPTRWMSATIFAEHALLSSTRSWVARWDSCSILPATLRRNLWCYRLITSPLGSVPHQPVESCCSSSKVLVSNQCLDTFLPLCANSLDYLQINASRFRSLRRFAWYLFGWCRGCFILSYVWIHVLFPQVPHILGVGK